MNIVSDEVFRWFLTLAVGVVAGIWFILDARALVRTFGQPTTPHLSDRRFGYMMGILIGAVGVIGTLRYQHVF